MSKDDLGPSAAELKALADSYIRGGGKIKVVPLGETGKVIDQKQKRKSRRAGDRAPD